MPRCSRGRLTSCKFAPSSRFTVTGSCRGFGRFLGKHCTSGKARSNAALYRLESKGVFKAEWHAAEGGREARYYRLTAAGRKHLDEERADWKRLCEVIALVLDAVE